MCNNGAGMNALITILLVACLGLINLIIFACLKLAGEADRRMEQISDRPWLPERLDSGLY